MGYAKQYFAMSGNLLKGDEVWKERQRLCRIKRSGLVWEIDNLAKLKVQFAKEE